MPSTGNNKKYGVEYSVKCLFTALFFQCSKDVALALEGYMKLLTGSNIILEPVGVPRAVHTPTRHPKFILTKFTYWVDCLLFVHCDVAVFHGSLIKIIFKF